MGAMGTSCVRESNLYPQQPPVTRAGLAKLSRGNRAVDSRVSRSCESRSPKAQLHPVTTGCPIPSPLQVPGLTWHLQLPPSLCPKSLAGSHPLSH